VPKNKKRRVEDPEDERVKKEKIIDLSKEPPRVNTHPSESSDVEVITIQGKEKEQLEVRLLSDQGGDYDHDRSVSGEEGDEEEQQFHDEDPPIPLTFRNDPHMTAAYLDAWKYASCSREPRRKDGRRWLCKLHRSGGGVSKYYDTKEHLVIWIAGHARDHHNPSGWREYVYPKRPKRVRS